jgi:calcium-dependent protein kinase
MLVECDYPEDWKINYTEFLASSFDKSILIKEERLASLFKSLDLDSSGKINKDELKAFMCHDPEMKNKPEDYWDSIIKEADVNGDGEIDYGEFVELICKTGLKH